MNPADKVRKHIENPEDKGEHVENLADTCTEPQENPTETGRTQKEPSKHIERTL